MVDESVEEQGTGSIEERAVLRVAGRVQGVFYRAGAMEAARRLGLSGWVRNVSDGAVEAVAEGSREAVDAFVAWCRVGPPAARVDEVLVEREEARGDLGPFRVLD